MTVRVNYQTTAVIDVDPEKGFSELCPNELPVAGALEIVPELLSNHAKGLLKLVSRDLHPPKAKWDAETPANMLEPVGLPNVDIKWNRHCVLGTTGSELLDGLPPVLDYDFQVNKGMDPDAHPYGIFFHDIADTKTTGAHEFLKFNGIDTLVIGGLALDFCVKKSVMQALDLGYNVVVNLASTRAVLPDNIENVLTELKDQGALFVEKADDIIVEKFA
ncbi:MULTISPECIES: isochorismatase family protein [Vibrio]|uniref:nicotinamidase n=1 Tax=Vibrio diabolicus TaxID=50719 RepID=A0AAX1XSF9_9VIBR|nr:MULTISPECIES: isochorismatase family protein [Vibrio]BCB44200.1 amidase [Vibrio alginolyticus]MCS0346923.1 isochorismatase family protein [Vibrio diabolicus]MCS0355758.1 isochorismatase family protein [Vibrio diabolicus]MCS0359027.1 isochorismatase family protein [Vibrio diabolicus]MCS0373578.1 isochorismatase family protein [Vibrio diabolicus]